MLNFVIHRIYVSILVAITVSVIGFSLLRISGDLAAELAGEDASTEEIAEVAKAYGLDRPFHVQYFDWAGKALSGDLGRSLFTNELVVELITDRIGVTFKLAIYSLILGLLLAVPLGVLASIRPNTWIDRMALGLAVFGQAIPNFWFALIMILFFGVTLRWLPISGSETAWHFVMPTFTLGLTVMPQFMRLTRTGMLDVLDSDFIRTARAKGLPKHKIILLHALKPTLLPVISYLGPAFVGMITGSVVIDMYFSTGGIGLHFVRGALNRDYSTIMGITILVGVLTISFNLVVDILYAWIDPKIRY